MVVGLLGNESSDLNRLTLVTPKSENDVRLQATLDNQNPTGLPVGVVRNKEIMIKFPFRVGRCNECGHEVATDNEYNFRRSDAKWKAYREQEQK